LSTRFVGAIIMVHGDDQGLVLPPRLAPYQTVIIPIYKTDEEKSAIMPVVTRINAELAGAGIRVKMDDRDHLTPGFKFNYWELRGVPTRIEIGPRDVAKNSVALARRDIPGREGKEFVSQEGLPEIVTKLLDDIHQAMFEKARRFREDRTVDVQDYASFKEAVKVGFARTWWAGNNEDELRIKEETKATIRCFPLEQPEGKGRCFYTGREANQLAIFSRAY
jgi:prolyl-tRNA synthetase